MRQHFGGPTLPKELRDQIGDPTHRRKNGRTRIGQTLNRKDRRKAERNAKKTQKPPTREAPWKHSAAPIGKQNGSDDNVESNDEENEEQQSRFSSAQCAQRLVKTILKKPDALPSRATDPSPSSPPPVSRAAKDRLAQDDAEIAALEKKLGVRRKKKKTKDADDGLDDIFGDLGDFNSDDDTGMSRGASKRKRDQDDEWLANKRRKALENSTEGSDDSKSSSEDFGTDELMPEEVEIDEDSEGDDENANVGLEDGGSDFEDFDSDKDDQVVRPRVRENPYVAPVTPGTKTTKYIPPALRGPPSSDAEALERLKRQIQGLLNRLSDANMMTILRDVEQTYQNNPRGYVTTVLIDLLIGLLADESTLPDTFLILHAGFITAIYKVIGPDFGAQMVERIVSDFDRHFQRNKEGFGKQTTNLMSVVAELYCFQLIGSNLVFDYIRLFLDELSEINTELLLRIVRVSGSQLRQDDPSSLKDIVLLLQKSVSKVGQHSLPVRTKFMIETINDLKNNRMKTGVIASAITSENTLRMKKQLGTLNTRNLKGTEPMRIGLTDIRNTDKKGKWWLVGASWRNDATDDGPTINDEKTGADELDVLSEQEADGEVDLFQLAREQRMNTDVRRAIFITIMSATDYKEAHIRLLKLNLKKAQEAEIPRIIVHCAGCENTYNPYYTLLARKFCVDHKSRKCFQFALWDVFKSLGEKKHHDEDDASQDEEDSLTGDMSLRRLVNLGKLYGTLIAKDGLAITSLKPLNFPYLKPKTMVLVEIMLVTVILESQKGPKGKRDEKALLNIFVNTDSATEMIAGLQYFIKKKVSRTEITANKKERETVRWACKLVMDMLQRLMATITSDEV